MMRLKLQAKDGARNEVNNSIFYHLIPISP